MKLLDTPVMKTIHKHKAAFIRENFWCQIIKPVEQVLEFKYLKKFNKTT